MDLFCSRLDEFRSAETLRLYVTKGLPALREKSFSVISSRASRIKFDVWNETRKVEKE